MEPRIQYAKTSDGVSIAYWTLGEGPPLIWIQNVVTSHIQMEWHVPFFRRWYEPLAAVMMLVRYDPRGFGLSDRDVTDSPEARQIEHVQGRLRPMVDSRPSNVVKVSRDQSTRATVRCPNGGLQSLAGVETP